MTQKNTFRISNDIVATKQIRFTNYLIDYFVQLLFFGVVLVLLTLLAEFLDAPFLTSWFEDMNRIQEYVYGAVISIIYYSIFEGLTSQSAGKFATNTIVVFEDGTRPPIETILRRSLYRVIPFNAFSFLGSNRGWHDNYTETYVVNKTGLKAALQRHNDFNEIGKTVAL